MSNARSPPPRTKSAAGSYARPTTSSDMHSTSCCRRRARLDESSRPDQGLSRDFLESIETSGYPVAVSRLDIRKRTGEPDSYDVEVEMKIQRLTTLLEPVMILAMGLSVGFVVFSILGPILKMNQFVS